MTFNPMPVILNRPGKWRNGNHYSWLWENVANRSFGSLLGRNPGLINVEVAAIPYCELAGVTYDDRNETV